MLSACVCESGGEEGLAKAASASNRVLPLSLRPDCPTKRPIFGERVTHRGLLVRVKRTRDGTRADVIARVMASYRFAGLADFHLCPDDSMQAKANKV